MNLKAKILIALVLWFLLAFGVRFAYLRWWAPAKAIAEHEEMIEKTSSNPHYLHEIRFGVDDFTGYAPIRSSTFRNECSKAGIRLNTIGDSGDYSQRFRQLADGKLDMAAFTLDSLIQTSAAVDDIPITVVDIVSESKGADAIIGYEHRFSNVDDLNSRQLKVVCVPDSSSETLARVVIANFALRNLPANPFQFVKNTEELKQVWRDHNVSDDVVFATWEPYVSEMCTGSYHRLIDSSKIRGHFVNVIVVQREFLLKNNDLVTQVIKSFRTTMFSMRNNMLKVVLDDAQSQARTLHEKTAEQIIKSIWWKNTQETYGHFGLASGANLQHIEEMCQNLIDVLIKTGAIQKDPTGGRPNLLYYDGIARKLFDSGWHPGFSEESIRGEKALAPLTEAEWAGLKLVGNVEVPRLSFNRGTAKLTASSETSLKHLADRLKSFPQYYLIVRGNAATEGSAEANMKIAALRAKTAADWLIAHGVSATRIKTESVKPNGSTTVTFLFGELPY